MIKLTLTAIAGALLTFTGGCTTTYDQQTCPNADTSAFEVYVAVDKPDAEGFTRELDVPKNDVNIHTGIVDKLYLQPTPLLTTAHVKQAVYKKNHTPAQIEVMLNKAGQQVLHKNADLVVNHYLVTLSDGQVKGIVFSHISEIPYIPISVQGRSAQEIQDQMARINKATCGK